jgi:A/G-specific adenine glycosylase
MKLHALKGGGCRAEANAVVAISKKEIVQQNLLRWFEREGRNLPWRKTHDPYRIWLSEIMLQQTQVDTVIPYYRKFLKTFPTVHHLARADLSGVLKIWEGLGYYSRARNLHAASKILLKRFHGHIPSTLQDLLSLPGIGRYTAGAILSIAFDQEVPILDGNVKRVLSRFFAVSGDPENGKTQNLLWHFSESLIPKGHSSAFNQALMDLGSGVCTPRDPLCHRCPLRGLCRAEALGHPERYPRKKRKKRIPHVEAVSAIILWNGRVLIRQRPPRGLLGGLWEFPNWEIPNGKNPKGPLEKRLREEIKITAKVGNFLGTFRHTYSHFKLTLHAHLCRALKGGRDGTWVDLRSLEQFPMSRLHRRIAQLISD